MKLVDNINKVMFVLFVISMILIIVVLGVLPIFQVITIITETSKEEWHVLIETMPVSRFITLSVLILTWGLIGVYFTYKHFISWVNRVVKKSRKSKISEPKLDADIFNISHPDCPHEHIHQVGFTNLIKCDQCDAMFVNPNFKECES